MTLLTHKEAEKDSSPRRSLQKDTYPQNTSTTQERSRIPQRASNRIKSKKGSKNTRLHYRTVTLRSGINNNPVDQEASLALKHFNTHGLKDIKGTTFTNAKRN